MYWKFTSFPQLLFFFPIIFISWRLITLQYCSGFCHTLTWISHGFTCILSSVKQIASPGWMHETSARDWCTGMTQRNGMGREVGGGFRMGNTCNSYVFSIVNSISTFQISACSYVSGCTWLFLNLGFYQKHLRNLKLLTLGLTIRHSGLTGLEYGLSMSIFLKHSDGSSVWPRLRTTDVSLVFLSLYFGS